MTGNAHLALDLSEQPLWFDSHGDVPLYGVFHRAHNRPRARTVALFCHSLGLDHLVTWRMEVLAARALAARGYPAFSYHARGHGDSAGSFADVTFQTLVEDALAASEQARRMAGASEIRWIATRFGALVATAALRRRTDTAGLALWEPVHRGVDHFHALMRRRLFFEVANRYRPSLTVDEMVSQLAREGELPLAAEWLHDRLYRSTLTADLARSMEDWRGPTMLAQVQKRQAWSNDNAALLAALRDAGAPVTAVAIVEQPTWENPAEPWWTSPRLGEETIGWLDGMA